MDWKKMTLPAGILIALIVIAYIPALRGGFVWDDDKYVTQNPQLRTVTGLGRIWLKFGAVPQYYPLVYTTFWVEYHLWGLRPFGYHLVNILLHGVNAVLLWQVLKRLGVPGSYLAAALFALHPVHVESVAWVNELKNVLSGTFYLGAALAYFRFAGLAARPVSETDRNCAYTYAAVFFICALLSKSVVCTLPAALLLVLWWKRDRLTWARDFSPLIPFFVIGLAAALLTSWVEKEYVGAGMIEYPLSILERFLIAGRAFWFSVGKLFWPHPLIFVYPRFQIDPEAWRQYLFPLIALAVLVVLFLLRSRVGKGPLVAVIFYTGTLLPALGFVNIYYQMQYTFVADHFQYLASIGLIALAAALVVTVIRRCGDLRVVHAAVYPVLLLPLGILTWQQGYIYKNLEILWEDTLAKNPHSWLAQANLGALLTEEGRLDQALRHCREAVRLKGDSPQVHNNLANVLIRLGKAEEGIKELKKAIQLKNDFVEANYNLGVVYGQEGRIDDAIAQFNKTLELQPRHVEAHYSLAVAMIMKGNYREAILQCQRALKLRPDFQPAKEKLWIALTRLEQMEAAATAPATSTAPTSR